MDLLKLKEKLYYYIDNFGIKEKNKLYSELDNLSSIFPFNEYEFIISNLLSKNKLTYEEYFDLRTKYISENMFLQFIEIPGPRQFGETWAQSHIVGLDRRILKPNTELDETYRGEYDLAIKYKEKIIKIEVKASRGLDKDLKDEPYVIKALSYPTDKQFDMNFQQIKLDYADVFVFLAVWRNEITYWILSSYDIESSGYYNDKQHSKSDGEGQIHFKNGNIGFFDQFKVEPNKLYDAIIAKFDSVS